MIYFQSKNTTKGLLFCLLAIILFNQSIWCAQKFDPPKSKQTSLDTTTRWKVKPSFALDTICFIGVLTGDPFYLRYYQNEYDKFEPQLTSAARLALANLKRKVKDDNKEIISASLTLYFSVIGDRNLDDLLKTVKDSREMKRRIQNTVYYTEEKWQMYESVRPDLRVIFSFLKDIGFEKYWKQNYLPNIERKIAEIKGDLPKYNVVREVENLLGYRLSSNQITAYILHFPKPHGIRVTGLRFIMSDFDPFKTTVFIAIHESMHPPYNLMRDTELKTALDTLRDDEFLMNRLKNHSPSLGYNTFEGLVEEDCVQALDQNIGEKLGVEIAEAHKRWKRNDEGIHVLAVALYSLMKAEKFDGKSEKLRGFLLRMIKSGKLTAGKIKPLYDRFYSDYN